MTPETKDETIYVGILVEHLEQIADQVKALIAAGRQLSGRRVGKASIDPGNILVDGKCRLAIDRIIRPNPSNPPDILNANPTVRKGLRGSKKRKK